MGEKKKEVTLLQSLSHGIIAACILLLPLQTAKAPVKKCSDRMSNVFLCQCKQLHLLEEGTFVASS